METIKTEQEIREEIKKEIEQKQSVQLKFSIWENPFWSKKSEVKKRANDTKDEYKVPKFIIKSNYEQVGVAWQGETKSGEQVINCILNRPNAVEQIFPARKETTQTDLF